VVLVLPRVAEARPDRAAEEEGGYEDSAADTAELSQSGTRIGRSVSASTQSWSV
jgi:hypothetical protein